MLRIFASGVLCAVALAGIACSNHDGSKATGPESNRERFIQDAQDRIDDLNRKLGDIRDDIASSDADQELQKQAGQLQQRIDDAKSKLDEIRASNSGKWEDLKGNVDQALADAGDFADQIKDKLGIN